MISRASLEPLDRDSATLAVLPAYIHPWLRSVVVLGFLSFVTSVTLLLLLAYRLIRWKIKSKRTNQFAVLIFNLLWADIQQALAFLLNVEWLRLDSVVAKTPICFTQGWLVSTGDLGSGVFCFAIGAHTFASVILNYRLPQKAFYLTIIALWFFVYGVSAIPIGIYGRDTYVRSGIWCWVHHDLQDIRLWTHYVWIFIFEFGNVFIYALIYMILLHRIRSGYYTEEQAKRVKAISNLMVVYPIVYVICTLPLASARMASMGGHPPSLARLCLAGAMITSNGWLDVLLYTLTRRIMVFSDEPPPDDNGFETFAAFWDKPTRFGNTYIVESNLSGGTNRRKGRKISLQTNNESLDDLCSLGGRNIKLITTTHVVSEPADPEDVEEMEEWARRMRPSTPREYWSASSSMKDLQLAHIPT